MTANSDMPKSLVGLFAASFEVVYILNADSGNRFEHSMVVLADLLHTVAVVR